jgi:hypothetical protein
MTDIRFADLDRLPEPLDPPAQRALALLESFLGDGKFQVR